MGPALRDVRFEILGSKACALSKKSAVVKILGRVPSWISVHTRVGVVWPVQG